MNRLSSVVTNRAGANSMPNWLQLTGRLLRKKGRPQRRRAPGPVRGAGAPPPDRLPDETRRLIRWRTVRVSSRDSLRCRLAAPCSMPPVGHPSPKGDLRMIGQTIRDTRLGLRRRFLIWCSSCRMWRVGKNRSGGSGSNGADIIGGGTESGSVGGRTIRASVGAAGIPLHGLGDFADGAAHRCALRDPGRHRAA
jgi:hypothetical protein